MKPSAHTSNRRIYLWAIPLLLLLCVVGLFIFSRLQKIQVEVEGFQITENQISVTVRMANNTPGTIAFSYDIVEVHSGRRGSIDTGISFSVGNTVLGPFERRIETKQFSAPQGETLKAFAIFGVRETPKH